MMRSLFLLTTIVFVAYLAFKFQQPTTLPPLTKGPWFGSRPRTKHEDKTIRDFTVQFSKEAIADLKARLSLPSRLVPPLEESGCSYGFNTDVLEEIKTHWTTKYNPQQRLKRINAFPHYKTQIHGLDVHFLRASPPKNSGKVVRPLLLIHGWPGSFLEFIDMLPHLTTPRDNSDVVFDVVVPSLPGYGFSEAASKPGMNVVEAGRMFVELMQRLGFKKFYVHGGDWGSMVASGIANYFPERLYGTHLNMMSQISNKAFLKVVAGNYLPSGWVMDAEFEKKWYPLGSKFLLGMLAETGYFHIQATKPDTIGIALSESPLGLTSYILEKFNKWTFTKGGQDIEIPKKLLQKSPPIDLDKLIDNVCLYWFTNSITSSMRLYKENMKYETRVLNSIPTDVPAGIVACEGEILVAPPSIARFKFTNIVSYTKISGVGHFAAMEAPGPLADDIFNFVRKVEATLVQ